jgi:hypothetical protein
MATQVEGYGGRALAWWRGTVWDLVEWLPCIFGGLILASMYHDYMNPYAQTVHRWAWVAGGIVLIIGNFLWQKGLDTKERVAEFKKRYDIAPNPDAIALHKTSIWRRLRLRFAFGPLYRAALATPFPSEERMFFIRCWEEHSKLFNSSISIEKTCARYHAPNPYCAREICRVHAGALKIRRHRLVCSLVRA